MPHTHTRQTRSAPAFSNKIAAIAYVAMSVLLVILGGFSFWAANRIDSLAFQRQAQFLAKGIEEIAKRTQVEQDSSAIWDDSVINLRANNEQWVADNLAEWMSRFFGHDRLYVMDADNRVIRAVAAGEKVGLGAFEADRSVVMPLVLGLRRSMRAASAGVDDSTAAITGLGALDNASFDNGEAGIVSVRPILPSTSQLTQAPGTEYLLVSIRVFDADFAKEVGDKYLLTDLHFDQSPATESRNWAAPVFSQSGKIVGFFDWSPYQPAGQLILDTAPEVLGFVAIAIGVFLYVLKLLRKASADLELSEAQAKYLAFHDALAGVPNRALFDDRLERALTRQRATGASIALHAVDLDHFKHVNDTLGHGAGDSVIRQVAARLQAIVSDVDTVARVGGDEFAVIQADVASSQEAVQLGERIVAELARPFDIGGHDTTIGASVGVAYCNVASVDAQDLMRQADLALYEAKNSGRGRCLLFAGEIDEAIRERRKLETELRAALAGEPGLELVYQPIYDTKSDAIAGAEALVRWDNPRLGRLSPAQFIHLAEERGIIDQLGLWVLREACTFATGSALPWVAVNVSPLQFRDQRFAESVLDVLRQTGLSPARLELEITEGLLLQNSPSVQSTLRRLRSNGIRIALDDFGTGYSSISYLMAHGIDKLKIDQSFVARIGQEKDVDDIVDCIVGLGRAMNLNVTAEGVETPEQRAHLEQIGCGQLQGYLLSRPVTPARLTDLLQASVAALRPGEAA